jgi:hypothetical protein
MNVYTSDFDKLIREFEVLPQTISETTFLNICRYSGSRFEEICSRILAFYFQPSNEHGLKSLLLSSLLEIITENKYKMPNEQFSIETEAYIEEKYLDILIRGESFAIGIENKIGAEVYNPLDAYAKLIDLNHKNNYKVVLSFRKITKDYELKNIKDNGFIIIYYDVFFRVIKDNLGSYYSNANPKYITFLFDFINTIESMSNNTVINDPQSRFFFDNSEKIENLIDKFHQHTNRVLEIQKEQIAILRNKISEKSGVKWWAYLDWDLGYAEFNNEMPRIGIESNYKASDYDPLKKFEIYITAWTLKDWAFYEKDILEKYSRDKYYLDTKTRNRAYLHMEVIEGNDQDKIIERLHEYYIFLKELVSQKTKK